MRLVKSTTLEKIIALRSKKLALSAVISLFSIIAFAQDNSPYSRYGLGDIVPHTNIVNRASGGVSAAHMDPLSINFNNPASYSGFITYYEEKSKKSTSGRVIFDVGLNFDNHTLKENNPPQSFTSSNALFSYMQLGIPLKKNWGLNFGLSQVSRIGYDIIRSEFLVDPVTGDSIENAVTQFKGDGGTFLATTGTGFSIKNLSVGFNFGYLFGKKEYTTKRVFINDTVDYKSSNYSTKTSFGNIFFNAGVQYKIDLGKNMLLRLGAYGNLKQTLNAQQDILRETFVSTASGDVQLDSVYQQTGIKGKIIYPATYGMGFMLEKKIDQQNNKYGTWLLGVDLVQNKWSQYRFYGAVDSVRNNWELRIGGQIRPEPQGNYFSNVTYRGGFFTGEDYIHVGNKLPLFGITAGVGLPLTNYSRLATQYSLINLSFEYIKRGNTNNLLRENLFRVSVGLSLSDLWFVKRKYN